MENPARLFNCVLCHVQTVICSPCDRGNIYCGPICASLARRASLRKANQRYQSSLNGKRKHAERQRRYRQRQKKMTDQGSQNFLEHAVLVCKPRKGEEQSIGANGSAIYCHFCGNACSSFLRFGFLRHFVSEANSQRRSAWPFGP